MNFFADILPYRKSYTAGLLLSKAFRILKRRTNEALAPYDITATEWGILGLLYESKHGVRLSDIAFEVGVKAPFVTKSINTLSKKQMVTVTSDPLDIRAKLANLTPAGKNFVLKVEKIVMSEVLQTLSHAKKRDVLGYVKTLISVVEHDKNHLHTTINLDHMQDE